MDLDTLRIALLAACGSEDALAHRLHGELEHWLDRALSSAEIDVALGDLVGHGLLAVRHESLQAVYLTTDEGRLLVSQRWEEFFPE
jgi:hypothetical protein